MISVPFQISGSTAKKEQEEHKGWRLGSSAIKCQLPTQDQMLPSTEGSGVLGWLVCVNVTQSRVTWEEGTLIEKITSLT